MSRARFDNECEGCRPALIDEATRMVFPDDSPPMRAIMRVWERTTVQEREAFHRFTCLNSRDPADLEVMRSITERFAKAAQS
jgi:hypothetical protein